jgi:hypothetical protein
MHRRGRVHRADAAWSRPRRFIAVRLRLADPNEPSLLKVPGYEFRVFVTNRS